MDSFTFQKIALNTNEIHCYFFKTEGICINRLEQYISSDELSRAERFKFFKDQKIFVISRGILRYLLGEYLNINPKELEFDYTSYGKPFLKHESGIKFNISHSGNMIVLAFIKDHEIGVDIEKIKDDFDVVELAQNFFSKSEIDNLEKITPHLQTKAFYRCWTRKEAFIKAEGSGLSFPLNLFSVSLDRDDKAKLSETIWDHSEKDKWSLFSYAAESDYIAAVAVRADIEKIIYYDLNKFFTKNGFKI